MVSQQWLALRLERAYRLALVLQGRCTGGIEDEALADELVNLLDQARAGQLCAARGLAMPAGGTEETEDRLRVGCTGSRRCRP